MEHENLVSCVVFDAMGTGDTFDKAILYALIKSSTTDPNDQLLIALKFGRIDVVQEEILSKGVNYLKSKMRPNKLKDIMTTALLEDRTEFVQFLIDLELVKMQTYLDMSTLNWLYNNVEDASILKTTLNYYGVVMKQSSPSLVGTALMATTANVLSMDTETAGEANKVLEMLFQRRSVRAKRDWTNLPTISELLLKMLGSFSSPYYEDIMPLNHNLLFPEPFQELFIWAVLYNRNDLAMLFWQYADDAISLGLIGCNLYHKIARALPSYDTNGQLMLATQKLCLEQVSKAMIELCYSKSNEKALYLLERPLITWGDHRCMPLAVHAECREFIASVACQHAIDFEWRAGIHANPVALILGYMCPLLLCTTKLIRFEEPSKLLEVATGDDIFQQLGKRLKPTLDTTKDEEEPSIPNSKKLEMFYRAPRTKFCAHTAFYAVFLVFFSYTLLFGLKADRVTVLEAILMVYLFSFGVETVRSFVKSAWERGSVGFHLAKWLRGNKWHPYDVALIFGCATAIALRLGLEETFIYAKSVYSIVLVFFFLRLFQMYAVNRKLGPKSVMIFHMLVELAVFLLILLIFLVPYGISTQAVLFPY
uniref:Ion_trans domain-containing protein n=1 Tax=Mesocestoides corti TaxID=53468 RepID=A0A5K3EMI1_MESCO